MLDLDFGAYGVTSDGVKKLLDQLVESCVTSLSLNMGSLEASKEMSQVTGFLLQHLSFAIMHANIKCLLDRLLLVG